MVKRRSRVGPEAPKGYVLIGLGGIGCPVAGALAPFLYSTGERPSVLLVDGDRFEEANRGRMAFRRLGPKAEVLSEELAESYGDRLTLIPFPRYVTDENVERLIGEGDVVFCMPDNHATRRLVDVRCCELRDVALFSGGNDDTSDGKTGTYGNVQIHLREAGRDLTNPLGRYHPEIAHPVDQLPTDQGCLANAANAPQVLFTNLTVAALMLDAFYAWRARRLPYEEAYVDILSGRTVTVHREVA
ncbi:MAG: ThiF family adenylyltransferase [Myxococcota bacterium]